MFLSSWSDLVCKVGEFRLFEILKKRQFRHIQIRISRQRANFYRPSIWRWKALNLYYLHLQGYLLNPNTLLKICDQSRILSLATHSDPKLYAGWCRVPCSVFRPSDPTAEVSEGSRVLYDHH